MTGATFLTRCAVAVVAAVTPVLVAGPLPTAGATLPLPDRRCADVPFVGVCSPMWEKPSRGGSGAPIGAVMLPELTDNAPGLPVVGGSR